MSTDDTIRAARINQALLSLIDFRIRAESRHSGLTPVAPSFCCKQFKKKKTLLWGETYQETRHHRVH